jgi:hypothetical protein
MLLFPVIMLVTGCGLVSAGLAGIFWTKMGTTVWQRQLGRGLVLACVLISGLLLVAAACQPQRGLMLMPGLALGTIVILLSFD